MNLTSLSFDINTFDPYIALNVAGLVFLFMTIVFGLLVFRQAIQMTQVLPTSLSPLVKFLVVAYVLVAIVAFILALGIVLS